MLVRPASQTSTIMLVEEARGLRHPSPSYDDAGNMLSVKDTPDPALGGRPSDQQCFTYDWSRRLTNAWTPQNGDCASSNRTVAGLGGADPYWKSYSYDVLGNRTASVLHRTAAAGGDVTSTYARPASGVDSARPHAVTSVTARSGAGTQRGVSSFTYDGAGNMTGRTVAGASEQALTWDAEGELASVSSDENGDGSVAESESDEFVYSADGDRLVRTQDGDTTVYLPGQEITLDGDTGAVSAKRYYTFAGQTVAVRTGTMFDTVTSVFSDPHGTGVIQIGNVSNRVVRRYMDPFGAPRDSAAGLPAGDEVEGSWVGDRGFLDKPEDSSGLTAVGARLYDAVLGAFISVDPVMDLADPQQWNAYVYANNNPMTFSDPTGLLLGPLIDGAYTAPTRGKPGSGGWQVGPNNTGYTGSWNNGGAGKWARPGTTYTPPVTIQRDPVAAQARAQASAAAKARAEEERARAAAEQRAREHAAAEAAHKKQAGIGQQVGGWLEAKWNGFRTWADSDTGKDVGAALGVLSAAIAVAGAVALIATGVGAPAGILALGAVMGAASVGIDCAGGGVDASCMFGGIGLAFGGLGRAASIGQRALGPAVHVENASEVGNLASGYMGFAGMGVSGFSSATGAKW
ncbi:RHS repeat-associated core domain-containing protein [Promicromonospora vindobonensis]|uniref:RHS repeat-associated core domain-containing protein n=1 Tax=Promicromonospora vindobonensis TaxID=195748 RepID=A0ABW5W275_9MICO